MPFPSSQRGGFIIGMVVGLLVGLALALGVALYVTKVPVPFINKVPQRSADQDAAEAEKNRNWDPNAPLAGKNPARPASAPASAAGPTAAASAPRTARDAPSLGGPAVPGSSLSTTGTADAFVYFVQAGAYARTEEAEAQRAKLAIQGFESRITEREQAGRVMYRVRIGPFNQRADAEAAKTLLDGAGMTAALVRVQRQ
ncbi:SPOR domain-containing protein [Methylibium sp.]|uniref:SPOR domain-containing protein n=1 Tax=Methylibium sp. TaxID=2067992 RepID=UPI00286B469E|nr:SPOR domain-containing protein [Methylibium sp.]